jgi:basic membrane protein A
LFAFVDLATFWQEGLAVLNVSVRLRIALLILMLLTGCGMPIPQAVQTEMHEVTETATPAETPTVPARMAAVFPGVLSDGDYNMLGYAALLAVGSELDVQIEFQEQLPNPEAAEPALRAYAEERYEIIWPHGGQYLELGLRLAKEYPTSVFILEVDEPLADRPANVWTIERNFQLGFYVLGALAARLTQTGQIAYLSGPEMEFTYAELNAVRQGVRDSGRVVQVASAWTGDFNDADAARRAADQLIAEGADVILCSLNLGVYGVFDAVKANEGRVLVTAKYADKSAYAPDQYVTTLLNDYQAPVRSIVEQILAGRRSGSYPLRIGQGLNLQLPLAQASPEVSTEIEKILQQVQSGEITVTRDTRR